VQVKNRIHLAELMRGLRKIPDVVRINRSKGNPATHDGKSVS
jgi:GTP pyrophosphokinase